LEPYLGEIRCFSFERIPAGWLPCDGRILPIQQYMALYSLLNNTYGGDGRTNFALPNLQGVVPIHFNPTGKAPGPQTNLGVSGGAETVTLGLGQLPSHAHPVLANNVTGDEESPNNNYPAALASPLLAYAPPGNQTVPMATDFVGDAGGAASHANMQPFAVVNYCIASIGIYPNRP
jgi:microcystin-dependent protein